MKIKKHGRQELGIHLYSQGEEDVCGALSISLFGYSAWIPLPNWLIPAYYEQTFNNYTNEYYQQLIPRAYGIWFDYGENYISIRYGIQDERGNLCDKSRYKQFGWFIPFLDWTFVRTTILDLDGNEYIDLPSDYHAEKTILQHCPNITFKIRDFDEEIIDAIAYHQQREWHRGTGWWKWLRHVTKPRILRYSDIKHSDEVGYGKNGWKGGCMELNNPLGNNLFNIETIKTHYKDSKDLCLSEILENN